MVSEALVELIRKKQEAEGWDQPQMANYLGVAYRTFQDIVSSSVIAKTDTLLQIAEKLGVSVTLNSAQDVVTTGKTNKNPAKEIISYLKEKIEPSLVSISDNVLIGRAEIRAKIEYDALLDAKGVVEKKDAIMAEINKLIGLNLSGDEQGSTLSSGGKQYRSS